MGITLQRRGLNTIVRNHLLVREGRTRLWLGRRRKWKKGTYMQGLGERSKEKTRTKRKTFQHPHSHRSQSGNRGKDVGSVSPQRGGSPRRSWDL